MYGVRAQKKYLWQNITGSRLHSVKIAISPVAKSDRVSALQKRYDSFLQGDKARKERNEYILGKLDKMRSCTTLVPLRNKLIIPVDSQNNVYEQRRLNVPARPLDEGFSTLPHSSDFSLGFLTNYIGEKILLEEMCKKYILIPKKDPKPNEELVENSRLAANYTETVPTIINDQSDWKRKYDILEKLKQDEAKRTTRETLVSKNKSQQSNNYKTPTYFDHNNADIERETVLEPEQEPPERDYSDYTSLNVKQIPKQLYTSHEESINSLLPRGVLDIAVTKTGDANTNEIKNNTDEIYKNEIQGQQDNATKQVDQTNVDFDEVQQVSVVHNPDEPKHKNMVFKVDEEQLQVMSSTEFVTQINNEHNLGDNARVEEQYEYPTDPVQTQDFTPGDGVGLQDGVNINPEGCITTQVYMNSSGHNEGAYGTEYPQPDVNQTQEQEEYPVYNQEEYVQNTGIAFAENTQSSDVVGSGTEIQDLDQSGYEPMYEHDDVQAVVVTENPDSVANAIQIEEFNAEQNDMFYSEQAANEEGNVNEYNTENIGPLTESYAYYQGAEQPIDINEHEETNQYYDQSYEQQYVKYDQPNQDYNQLSHEQPQGVAYDQTPHGQEGYDQTQANDQSQIDYDQSQANYDQLQMNYDRLHYDETNYENQGLVEQQLDQDQNFAMQPLDYNPNFVEQKPDEKDIVGQQDRVDIPEKMEQSHEPPVNENVAANNTIPEVTT